MNGNLDELMRALESGTPGRRAGAASRMTSEATIVADLVAARRSCADCDSDSPRLDAELLLGKVLGLLARGADRAQR